MCLTPLQFYAQISPGDLSKAHAFLEGISNCTKCHSVGEQLKNSSCLNCHSDIKQLINQNRGYHSTSSVKSKNCWNCHGEHFGKDFKIINFERRKFDHSITGFKLEGKHSLLNCEDCHNKKYANSTNLIKKNNSFLGLEKYCNYCHEDYHQGSLNPKCEGCHNTTAFRPAVFFNHNSAKFKLTGKHEEVKCINCHLLEKRNGKNFQKFTGLNFNNCSPCHKDFHNGKYGSDCKKCHVVGGFKFINKSAFDHSRTNYPLMGAHRVVDCRGCHRGSISEKPQFDKCFKCHKDYHNGEFTKNNVQKDCSVCHTLDSFTPSTFSIEEHNNLEFKLTGGHLAIECRDCHFKVSRWFFRITDKSCINCHKNIHGNEITENTKKLYKCVDCHSTLSWNDIKYNHIDSGFELSGKHAKSGCKDCHYNYLNGRKQLLFASTTAKCEDCHRDIHMGQFSDKGESSCFYCHSFDNWQPVKFNHSLTKFSLEGGHKNINCKKCHPTEEKDGVKYIRYKLAEFKCSVCHS